MKTTTKRRQKTVIFFSHASADAKAIQPLKDALNAKANGLLKKSEWELFWSSDPQEPPVKGGEDIWDEIRNRLLRCVYFVVFCSPNYFKSQHCQNELGMIKGLEAVSAGNAKLRIIPVKLADLNSRYFNLLVNQAKLEYDVRKPENLVALFKMLQPALKSLPKASSKCYSKIAKEAADGRRKWEELQDHRIVSLWQKHLDDRRYSNSPVTFFIEFCQYAQVAEDLSEKGTKVLLWALNRSPLLTKEAYNSSKRYLLDHDIQFQKLRAEKKYRLVIFKDWQEAESYIKPKPFTGLKGKNIDVNQQIKRRMAFEKSVQEGGAELWFTTRERARKAIASTHANCIPAAYDSWDFGFAKTNETSDGEFLFVSGFDSRSFTGHADDLRHLTLYANHHDERYCVFGEPEYALLYCPLLGLCDVATSLIRGPTANNSVFVNRNNIAELRDRP
jgi:hypothetical protein